MKLHKDSHVDHGLTERQLSLVLERYGDHAAFFATTFELPEGYGDVPCALVGPLAGTPTPADAEIGLERRGERTWSSRVVRVAELPRTRLVTVIAGPHDGEACVLYTCYGGPMAPREPGDIRREIETLEAQRPEERRQRIAAGELDASDATSPLYARILELRKLRAESDAFWAKHAIAIVG
jgi:hypothetical protein